MQKAVWEISVGSMCIINNESVCTENFVPDNLIDPHVSVFRVVTRNDSTTVIKEFALEKIIYDLLSGSV